MRPSWTSPGWVALLALAGCEPSKPEPRTVEPARTYPAPQVPTVLVLNADTDKDRTFGEYVREHSSGMVARASVGLEKAGMLRLDLDRSVTPDDVLEMTRSLYQHARLEFPDRSINLALFDPGAQPILKVRYRPDRGVSYQLVATRPSIPDPGRTDPEQKFAQWAKDRAGTSLTYVETDLEHHRRIWFGVLTGVKPEEVAERVRPILEKARTEFPTEEIQVRAFNSEGDPLSRATIDPKGTIHWGP